MQSEETLGKRHLNIFLDFGVCSSHTRVTDRGDSHRQESVCVSVCVCESVNDREKERAWREGIFGLHAVLHKCVIAC